MLVLQFELVVDTGLVADVVSTGRAVVGVVGGSVGCLVVGAGVGASVGFPMKRLV